MGSCCSFLDELQYEFSKDIDGKVLCSKCGDRYKPTWGCKSERTSCRNHIYIKNNGLLYCIHCNRTSEQIISRNCYHSYF